MKRDWDVIRQVLVEVEALDDESRGSATYGRGEEQPEADSVKAAHALLLWKAGYLEGVDGATTMGPALFAPDLSWAGHDLLDTLRSEAVWERIKITAKEKGLELTFDAVKALGRVALDYVLRQGAG
jgi:hypothetical protein